MNTNERLTAAAQRGAQGKTLPYFNSLPQEQQDAVVAHVLSNRALTEEIIRSSLLATSPTDLEDVMNEMGTTSAPDQKLHTGD